MKVNTLIQYLKRNYSDNQEVLAFIVGSHYKEMKPEVWEKAVEIWDSEDNLATFANHIDDLIIDAEFNLEQDYKGELAIDSYLADEAEKELANENV